MKKKDLKDILTSFPVALAYCHLARIFRPFAHRKGLSFLAVLVVPSADVEGFYQLATEYVLRGTSSYGIRRFDDPIKVVSVKRGKANFSHILGDTQDRKPTILLFESAQDVPPEYEIAADIYKVMEAPDIAVCCAAIYHMCGTIVSDVDAEFVLSQPWKRTAAAFRQGRPAKRTLQLLRSFPQSNLATVGPPPTSAEERSVGLEDLAGYGEAGVWGLQLAKDLNAFEAGDVDWNDVDRGVLLSGPPGVGKTRFAEALAVSCNAAYRFGSVTKWQAAGHMGDLLREMRKAFEEAAAIAPCILLIDEIDAFGDRAKTDGEHGNYVRQVIAGALECLDGAVRRDGVVVIGTANFPENMDPAFLRPGRLDRHIRLPNPDPTSRLKILERYLGAEVLGPQAQNIALATEEWSGAALEQLARDSRRRARLANRRASVDDVIAFLPDVVQMPADRLMTTAIHESGHALIGLAVGRTIEKAKLADRFIRGSDRIVLGGVHFLQDLVPRRTRQFYLDEIAISLAGIAAEVEITGCFDDGAGSSRSSDLANATQLATMLEGVLGMGDSLVSDANELGDDLEKLRSRNPELRNRIERVLVAQMAFATQIVVENRQLILDIAALFVERIEISGEEIERFVEDRKLNANLIPDSNEKPLCWLGGRLS